MVHNKNHRNPVLAFTLGVLLVLSSGTSSGAIVNSSLAFSSQDQSMWGSGGAFQLDEDAFLGLQWDKSASAGGFDDIRTDLPNPALIPYAANVAAYGVLYAAYLVELGLYEIADAAWVICPFLCGSRPTRPSAPTAPGPPPPATVNVSLGVTGAEVSASTKGRVGFELGVKIDSGSVDAVVTYDTTVITPENNTVAVGEFIVLQTSEVLTGEDLSSQFPTASAELSVVMEVSAAFGAEACVLSVCTGNVGFNTGTIGGTQEIISFNQDGNGGIEYFGGTGPLSTLADLAGLPSGFPAVIEIPAPSVIPISSNIATITAHLPQPNATYDGIDGGKLTASGQDDLLDVSLDVDTLVSLATTCALGACSGALFGGGVDLGLGFGVSYDLINVELGPKIDLVQEFELTPTLLVDLQFSRPVWVAGLGQVTSLASEFWDNLPAMAFMDGTTDIFPEFHLGYEMGGTFYDNAAMLFSELFLDVDGNIKIDLLTATFSTPFADLVIGIGNLVDKDFNLFSTPALFDDTFAMLGFNRMAGNMFSVTVPEPGVILLFGTGFFAIGLARRRRKSI